LTVRRSLIWTGGAQVALFVFQFTASIVLARTLTPYEMGIYALASAIVGVVSTIQSFGLVAFIVREEALTDEMISTVFSINAALAVLMSVCLFAISQLGGVAFHDSGVRDVLRVLAFLPMIGAIEFLPASQFERNGSFNIIAGIGMIKNLTITFVVIWLAFMHFRYMSIAYSQLTGAAVSAILYVVIGRRHWSNRIGFKHWRRVLSYGVQILAISGINSAANRSADLLLGRFLGLSALGLYGRAVNVNRMLWDNIHIVIGRVVFVELADQMRNTGSVRGAYLRTIDIVTALLWPAFAGLAILAGPFIYNVYGPRWTAAAIPLGLLCLASMILVSITMTWEIFVISEKTAEQTRIEFIRTAVGLALFAAGCTVSVSAAALARVADAVFSMILYRPHLERMTGTRLADFIPIYLRSGLLTVLTVAPAGLLMVGYRGSPVTPIGYVGAAVMLGAFIWGFGLMVLKHPLFLECKVLLRRTGWQT
jgi:O-antigen/teichoic acid export membrane protein